MTFSFYGLRLLGTRVFRTGTIPLFELLLSMSIVAIEVVGTFFTSRVEPTCDRLVLSRVWCGDACTGLRVRVTGRIAGLDLLLPVRLTFSLRLCIYALLLIL